MKNTSRTLSKYDDFPSCSSLFAHVAPMFVPVRPSSSLFVPVRKCLSLFVPVRKCLSLFVPVRPCL